MDKHLTKKLLAAEGLPTPAWDMFDLTGGTLPLLAGFAQSSAGRQAAREGSSTGVSIVRTHEEWTKAMIEASKRTTQILAEEYVEGREFSCAVLGEEALPIVEIIAERRASTPTSAKYDAGGCTHIVPAPIDDDLGRAPADARALGAPAARVARLLAHRFHRPPENRPYLLEINSLPGLTPASLLPDECAAAGIAFEALIDRLRQLRAGARAVRDAVA